ncbi:MAG: hypothetical protein GAK40_00697 [Burkholderia plantarii]|nr:MAG: hypothetical protein GAK40_00697 [Burkholderia plantarii]
MKLTLRWAPAALAVVLAAALASCSTVPQRPDAGALGTRWGEGIESRVTSVALERQSQTPVAVQVICYRATRAPGAAVKELSLDRGRLGVAVLGEDQGKLDLVKRDGYSQVQGVDGARYTLWLHNYGAATFEVVATVDGLDVLSGRPGSFQQRGYVLEPGRQLRIEGFRKSDAEVAAFRFSSAADAYANATPAGDARNLGTIGIAVFRLDTPASKAPAADQLDHAFPANSANGTPGRYAPAPQYRQ